MVGSVDGATLEAWFTRMGWRVDRKDDTTLRVTPPGDSPPAFYARCAESWVLLAIVPVIARGGPRPPDLSRRLLAVTRDMRLAKLAYDEDGDVLLSAELPTESLVFTELCDTAERMVRYAAHYRAYLTGASG